MGIREPFGSPNEPSHDTSQTSLLNVLHASANPNVRLYQEYQMISIPNIIRRPGRRWFVAACAITFVAIPVALNVALFAVLDAVVLHPLPYPASDRIVCISSPNDGQLAAVPGVVLDSWRRGSKTCDGFAGFRTSEHTMMSADGAERIPTAAMTANLIAELGTRVAFGRPFQSEDEQPNATPVALVSHDFWTTHLGGDFAALGRSVRLNRTLYQVVGILPADFSFFPDLVRERPAMYLALRRGVDWAVDGVGISTIARLKPGVSRTQARDELNAIARDFLSNSRAPDSPGAFGQGPLALTPLLEAMNGSGARLLWLLLGAGAVTICIACLNVASLLRLQVSADRRTLAIRMALGAPMSKLTFKILGDCALLAAVGSLLGILLANFGLHLLVTLFPGDLPLARLERSHVGIWEFLFGVLLGTFSASLTALLPVLEARRTTISELLHGSRPTSGPNNMRPQTLALALQAAGATCLLIIAIFMLRNFYLLGSKNLGFDYTRVLTASIDLPRNPPRDAVAVERFDTELMRRLAAVPGVAATATSMGLPLGVSYKTSFAEVGHSLPPGTASPVTSLQRVSRNYLKALHIPLLEGRDFHKDEDCVSSFPAIINQSMAATYWPGISPVGRRLTTALFHQERIYVIIGVAGDTLTSVFDRQAPPTLYTCEPSDWNHILVRTITDPYRVVPLIFSNARALEPAVSVGRVRTMNDLISGSIARPRAQAFLVTIFAGASALLALLGMYAAVAEWVVNRNREIGIRIALGARPGAVIFLVMRQAAVIGVVGGTIGSVTAALCNRLVRSLVFHSEIVTAVGYIAVTAVFLGVILLSSYFPARRASLSDPSDIVRQL